MDYGLNTSLAAVEVPYVGVAPPTTYILPPWELTPASCRAVVIVAVLVDQELLGISYTSFAFDAETPSAVPPMAYTLSPEWPATRLARPVSISARGVQVFVCGSYMSTSFVTPASLHPPKTYILPPCATAAMSERWFGSDATGLQVLVSMSYFSTVSK